MIKKILSGVCLLVSLSSLSIAQTHPNQGNPVDNLPQLNSPKPQSKVDVKVQTQDDNMKKLLDTQINCQKVNIQGVTAIDFKEVSHYFEDFVGKTVNVSALIEAANKVTQIYKDKGYPLSFAFVPNQDFKDGIVNIIIVEGYVSKVSIKGEVGPSKKNILSIAEKLKLERPLTQASFERVINLLAMQAGMQITANIAPPQTTDGQTEMVLDVKHKKISIGWGLQNVSSGLQGVLSVTENALTPFGEQITLTTLIPKGNYDKEYYGITYNQPLGSNGLMFKVDAFHYRGDPQNDPLIALGYNSRYLSDTKHIGASFSFPFILNNHQNLTVSSGLYEDNSHQTYIPYVLAPDLNIASSVRVFKIETTYLEQKDKVARNVTWGLYKGVDVLGASQDKAGIDLNFFRTRLQLIEAHELPYNLGVKLSGVGQYSAQKLPTTEQLSFGGTFFGLAYPSGEIAGDKGYGVSAELNRSFNFSILYLKSVQPYILLDHSTVLSNSGPLNHRSLSSAGLGVRFSDKNHYNLDLSVAQPLGDKPIEYSSRHPQFNILYTYQLP